jgi:hypothetical protein
MEEEAPAAGATGGEGMAYLDKVVAEQLKGSLESPHKAHARGWQPQHRESTTTVTYVPHDVTAAAPVSGFPNRSSTTHAPWAWDAEAQGAVGPRRSCIWFTFPFVVRGHSRER